MNMIAPNKGSIEVNLAGEDKIFLYVNPVYDQSNPDKPLLLRETFATCRFKNIVLINGKYYPKAEADEIEHYDWIETNNKGFVLHTEDETGWYTYNRAHYPLAFENLSEWIGTFRFTVMQDYGLEDAFFVKFWHFYGDLMNPNKKIKLHYDFLPEIWFEEWGEFKYQICKAALEAVLEDRQLKTTNSQHFNEKDRKGIVYFLQNTETLAVKIGWTTKENLKARIANLQIGNCQELKLIKTIQAKNAFQKEQELHKLFEQYRIRGEWFRYGEKIKSFLDK